MSKIKNGGLDLDGKVWSLNGIGGERVKTRSEMFPLKLSRRWNTNQGKTNEESDEQKDSLDEENAHDISGSKPDKERI